MKYLNLSLISTGIFSLISCNHPKVENPNVIFITVDDLNDWVEDLHGHPQSITPNMNRLFAQGVLFTNAHSSQPVSTASRNSLLSGLHPTKTGWYGSTSTYRENYDEVMKGNMMLPEYFKNNGYNTFVCGKIFHNGDCDFPNKKKDFWTECAPHFWDEMEANIEETGYGYRGYMFYPFPEGGGQLVKAYGKDSIINHYQNTNRFYSLCGGPLENYQIPKQGMYDEQIANWAINKIKEDHKKPFFLAVGFIRPHVPYTAHKKYFKLFNQNDIIMPEIPENEMEDIPDFGKAIAFGFTPNGCWYDIQKVKNAHKELVHSYLASIAFVDEQIGKVIDALEKNNKMNNTIIVLCSDHGQHLGEKHHFRKQALWEESTRVPLFFRIPNATDYGKTNNSPVSLLDIYPTLLKACNLPNNPTNQGKDLTDIIKDASIKKEDPVLISWYYKNFAVRSENWRYILYRDGSEELYNHINDPNEHDNLANNKKYSEIKKWHKKFIPNNVAIPAGMKEWKGDKYSDLLETWKKNDSIPNWLR